MSRHAGRLLALVVAVAAVPAVAHDRTTSYSVWELRGREAAVRVTVSALDVSRFPWASEPGATERLGAYLASHLSLLAGATPCPLAGMPQPLAAEPGRLAWVWRSRCPPDGPLALASDLFVDLAPGHLHFARLVRDGGPAEERVLSDRERTWPLAQAVPGTPFAGYVRLGIVHILSGTDHLAFLLAFLLIGADVAEVARVVTGFTVAHSLTLGLAVLGWVRPDRGAVEALIGLSIALVAAENLWLLGSRRVGLPTGLAAALGTAAVAAAVGFGRVPPAALGGLALFTLCYFALLARVSRTASLRWAIAFLFGLVHGFGFAAVLTEAGLEPARLAGALLGFNIGVEAGQLALVAAVWPLLGLALRRPGRLGPAVVEAGSAAVLALGVFWFVVRAYG